MLTSILMAILGGALLGIAASAMMFLLGRIAGISGIVSGLLRPKSGDVSWRLSFFLGLLTGGLILLAVSPNAIAAPVEHSLGLVAVAGLLVGFGTRLGNGCTSGHGICGLTRLSRRSLAATLAFMITGFIAATSVGLWGGA